MKKLFIMALGLAFTGTGFAQSKKFVTFRADISNRNGDVIYIQQNKNVLKKIQVKPEGFFKDTLSVKEGMYLLNDGVEYTQMYLKNGYDLKLKMDAKNFDNSIVYEGVGAAENNYLAKSTVLDHEYEPTLMKLIAADEAEFKKGIEEKKAADLKRLKSAKLDPNFVALETENIEQSTKQVEKYYMQKSALKKMNDKPSAPFDYENYQGGKTSLASLKGKYVYIDVWATWCGPCRAEIPYLKSLEEKYHGKNIEFVSISADAEKDHDKWKKFVTDKELKGTQLFADKSFNSDFLKAFSINSIPRFILIDPTGKVINADAQRPSNPEIVSILDSLLK